MSRHFEVLLNVLFAKYHSSKCLFYILVFSLFYGAVVFSVILLVWIDF